VEVDGEQHDPVKDSERDSSLELLGVHTYRIPSLDIWQPELLAVHLDQIFRLCVERTGFRDLRSE
jgi:very-short-patch-repair endonuclease